jgi:vancomycin resistance protein VanJ
MLIECRCGETYSADEQDAGGWLRCRCGRIVQVPRSQGRTGVTTTAARGETRAAVARWLGRGSWGYLAATAIAWVVLWTLSDRWWPATLFLFGPRWVLLLPLVALLPAAVVLRASLLAPLLAAAAIVLVPVMGLQAGWRSWLGARGPAPSLRIVTLNTGGSEAVALELPFLLDHWRADIVALQECGRGVRDAVRGVVAGWHAHVDDQLCLLSRYSTRDARGIRSDDLAAAREAGLGGSSQATIYVIETPERPIRVVNLHLETPRKGIEGALQLGVRRISENTALRATESRRTREWLGSGESSLIVVGDFNMPVESAIYRRDWSEFRNAFSEAGVGFGATRDNGWIQVRIDHVVTGPAWRARRAVVGPVTGVDHRPVIVDLSWLGSRR